MRLFFVLLCFLYGCGAHGAQCVIGCTYVSEMGIPAGACAENVVDAMAEAQINCMESFRMAFPKGFMTEAVAMRSMSSCRPVEGDVRLHEIRCEHYESRRFFDNQFLKRSCSLPRDITVFGRVIRTIPSDCDI